MVNYYLPEPAVSLDANLSRTFGALSDPTRRAILARLALGSASVTELAAPYDMSLPAVSKHLRILEAAGLMTRRKHGRVHQCRLAAGPLQDVSEWLNYNHEFWETRFDALADYLENNDSNPEAEYDEISD